MTHDETVVDELAAEICAYLEAHPDAADTVDGVVQWWIVHERWLRGIGLVAQALDRLVAEGRIEAVRGADARVVYRAARPSPPPSPPRSPS
jgi:hypothetical protein